MLETPNPKHKTLQEGGPKLILLVISDKQLSTINPTSPAFWWDAVSPSLITIYFGES